MISLLAIEKRHGTARTLAMCHEYIRQHKREKSALLQVQRAKGPKGSNRRSGYLKARRECDKAFSAMIRRTRGDMCELHAIARNRGVALPTKCAGKPCLFHILSKASSETLRYDPMNVLVADSGANKHESYHRAEWSLIFDRLFPERMKELREKAKWRCKRNELMLRDMINEFNRQ